MFRLAVALFLMQSGFHGFTASLPIALADAGVSDPTIGLIIGTAAVAQIPAAFVVGVLLDRFGGLRVMLGCGVAYMIGALILAAPGVDARGSLIPFFAARLFQGMGFAGALASGLSLVPALISPRRQGVGLAFVNSAFNLSIVALPPISLAVLAMYSLSGVALGTIGLMLLGLVAGFALPSTLSRSAWNSSARRPAGDDDDSIPAAGLGGGGPVARRRLGLAYRRTWMGPLAVVLLYVMSFGVLTAYLPPRAERAEANIGLFFAADGLGIVLSRIPVGWLADRHARHGLVLVGLTLTLAAVFVVLFPLTTPLLIVAGLLTGVGAGFTLTPSVVELSRRSGDADRGSAFSLFSVSLAVGTVLGTVGTAPIVAISGFEGAAIVAIGSLVLSAVTTLYLWSADRPARTSTA